MNISNLALGLSLGAFIFSLFAFLTALLVEYNPRTTLVASDMWISTAIYEEAVSDYPDTMPRCQDLPSAEWGQDVKRVLCLLEVPK